MIVVVIEEQHSYIFKQKLHPIFFIKFNSISKRNFSAIFSEVFDLINQKLLRYSALVRNWRNELGTVRTV